MDNLQETISHALETVFVVKTPIWSDEKDAVEQNTFFPHLKIGTILTIHAVIITDYDIDVKARYSKGSLYASCGEYYCGQCPIDKPPDCDEYSECLNMTMEFPLNLLATHCDIWVPGPADFEIMHLH